MGNLGEFSSNLCQGLEGRKLGVREIAIIIEEEMQNKEGSEKEDVMKNSNL